MLYRLQALLMLVSLSAGLFFSQPTSALTANWQQGANLQSKSVTDFGSDSTKQSLQDLATAGANMATFVVSYYQSDLTSCDIAAGFNTPTDVALQGGIANARAVGLKAAIVIHLETKDNTWRAYIQPTDRDCWYSAYGNLLTHYASLGQSSGLAQLSMGAEMRGVTLPSVNPNNPVRWKTMIQAVRSNFSGSLTYDAQPGEVNNLQFWPLLDLIQISCYNPIKITGDLTINKIKAAWAPIEQYKIRPIYAKFNKPITFGEVGYRSLELARNDPYSFRREGAVDLNEQKLLYQGFFAFWNSINYLQGIQLWEWETDPAAGGATTSSYTVQAKPAEAVIARWFGGSVPVRPLKGLTVWWPTQNATLSGTCQYFKALVSDRPINSVNISWRVDGDQLNAMYISNVDAPHWEAQVDVTTWNWKGSGPYLIEFVAANSQTGQVESVTPVTVYTAPGTGCYAPATPSRPASYEF